jgi:hypothetical protein
MPSTGDRLGLIISGIASRNNGERGLDAKFPTPSNSGMSRGAEEFIVGIAVSEPALHRGVLPSRYARISQQP